MKSRARVMARLNPEVEAFLYALLDESHDEHQFSVLTALARLDIDPWTEAERLAALPKRNAARRLAQLMAALPDASVARRDTEGLARRLVQLLPDHRGLRRLELPQGFSSAQTTGLRMSFFLGMLLGMQWFATSCEPQSQLKSSVPTATASSTRLQSITQ